MIFVFVMWACRVHLLLSTTTCVCPRIIPPSAELIVLPACLPACFHFKMPRIRGPQMWLVSRFGDYFPPRAHPSCERFPRIGVLKVYMMCGPWIPHFSQGGTRRGGQWSLPGKMSVLFMSPNPSTMSTFRSSPGKPYSYHRTGTIKWKTSLIAFRCVMGGWRLLL
jgi:hypothetical protein